MPSWLCAMSETATSHPAWASPMAIARPMPRAAPVTSATFPSRSIAPKPYRPRPGGPQADSMANHSRPEIHLGAGTNPSMERPVTRERRAAAGKAGAAMLGTRDGLDPALAVPADDARRPPFLQALRAPALGAAAGPAGGARATSGDPRREPSPERRTGARRDGPDEGRHDEARADRELHLRRHSRAVSD